jgi:hypothetical protein
MHDLGKLMKIDLKLSVKKVSKKGPEPNTCDHPVWDELRWDGQEKKLHDLTFNLCISHMWKDLFFRANKTPLQKLTVAVNRGSSSATTKEKLTKEYLVESLDHNIV